MVSSWKETKIKSDKHSSKKQIITCFVFCFIIPNTTPAPKKTLILHKINFSKLLLPPSGRGGALLNSSLPRNWNLCPHPTLPSMLTSYDDSFLCLPHLPLSSPWLHSQCHCCCVSAHGLPLLVTRWPGPSPARCLSAQGLLHPPDKQMDKNSMEFSCFKETILRRYFCLSIPPPPLPRSLLWWWGWVGQASLKERTSLAPWTSQLLLCEPAEISLQSKDKTEEDSKKLCRP